MNSLIQMLNDLIQTVLFSTFFIYLLKPKYGKRITYIINIFLTCLFKAIQLFICYFAIFSAIHLLIIGSLLILLYDERISRKLYIFIIYVAISITGEIITSTIFIFIFNLPLEVFSDQSIPIRITLFVIFDVISIISYIIAALIIKKNSIELTSVHLIKSSLFLIGQLFIIIFWYMRAYKNGEHVDTVSLWIILASVLLSNYFLFRLFKEVSIQAVLKEKNKFLNDQQKIQYEYYCNLDEQIQITKKYRHDIANHIQVIQSLLTKNNFDEAKDYTEQLKLKYDPIQNVLFSDYPVVDAVLFNKYQIANKNGIDFQANINLTENLNIEKMDLVSVISNILDNALEACLKINDEEIKKYIIINSYIKADMLTIHVENSKIMDSNFNSQSLNKDQNYVHGLGKYILKEICTKYYGFFTTTETDNSYTAIASMRV